MNAWNITGGNILFEGELRRKDLAIAEATIVAEPEADAEVFDAEGYCVLPGIVDIHGDGFEKIIEPRPGVFFDKELALREADRQLISNGITTAFHGVGVSWEPGVRSMGSTRDLLDAWSAIKQDLACETFLNLRWEVYALDALDEILAWLTAHEKSVLSINDHATAYFGLPSDHPKIIRMARRMGISAEETVALLSDLARRADEVPQAISELCSEARASGIKVFAHDETSVEQRTQNRTLGMEISEFPMTVETAREAVMNSEHVVLGAPNVVRGESQNNALCATSAITDGICTVLASDYFYPAQLLAVSKLVNQEVLSLADAWKLISTAPALAVGLSDRGELAIGKRADVVVVDQSLTRVMAVFAKGRLVYHAPARDYVSCT